MKHDWKEPFSKLKKWYRDAPYVVTVDKRHLKLLKDGETGDVFIAGKTFEDPSYPVVSAKGSSEHAISLDDDWAEELAKVNERHKVAVIKVRLVDKPYGIFVVCPVGCDLIDEIYKVEKK